METLIYGICLLTASILLDDFLHSLLEEIAREIYFSWVGMANRWICIHIFPVKIQTCKLSFPVRFDNF